MPVPTHPIIVLGSSAGGWDALPVVLENLPADLPASVFVVQHLPSDSMGTTFLSHLARRSVLPCSFALNGEPIRPGRVYVAPPDQHLLLAKDHLVTSRGPRENGFRPSVDTLFRSAAAHFASAVIGVILSGMRDDGSEGLSAISRSGGLTVVQDPAEAPFPEMPRAALDRVEVDYKVNQYEMGLVLAGLVYHPVKPGTAPPNDVLQEARIAQRVLTSFEELEKEAQPSPYSCPACGGVLWDMPHGDQGHSYRCVSGHAYTDQSLMQFKTTEIEETLWAALRLMEEHKRMLQKFANGQPSPGQEQRLAENQIYIDRLRALLLDGKG